MNFTNIYLLLSWIVEWLKNEWLTNEMNKGIDEGWTNVSSFIINSIQ